MSKNKKWMMAACILLGAGILICVISLATIGFDLKKLNTVKYVTKDYDIEDDFQNINIDADIEKIEFAPSEDKNCSVRCYEEEKNPHHVRVEGDTLKIGRKNSKWHWNLGIVMEGPEITVYLPKKQYHALDIDGDTGDVMIPGTFSFDNIRASLTTGDISCFSSAAGDISIETDTGDITMADFSASGLEVESNTGDITMTDFSASGLKLESDTGGMDLSDVKLTGDINIEEDTGSVSLENISCSSFTSSGDTGRLSMTKVIAEKEFHLQRDTGDIKFDGCDAKTIYVKTETGSVTGSLLTDKVFITKTDTGSVDVPGTAAGGKCEITTDTGDIRIEIDR